MRSQLGAHLFELLALAGLEDLNNPAQSRGPEIVELILEALVVVAVILKHYGDLVGLFRGYRLVALFFRPSSAMILSKALATRSFLS